jgi:hypothetical protein
MRRWMPKVGERVKLRSWEDYQALIYPSPGIERVDRKLRAAVDAGMMDREEAKQARTRILEEIRTPNAPEIWAWFEVTVVETWDPSRACRVRLRHVCRAVNAPEPAWEDWVPLGIIAVPLGWESVYTITCKSEELARKVIDDWFARGIYVWQSQDLSCAGRQAFTPMTPDRVRSPHWQYGSEPLEAVEPAECKNVFKVVLLDEREEFGLPTERGERRKAIAGRKWEHPERTYEYDKRSQLWVSWCEIVLYTPEEG